jgi:carbamoyl-phosphate synthase large subunit
LLQERKGNFNVLISSSGRRVALLEGFRRAMVLLGIPGRILAVDCSLASAAFHRADNGYLVPRCTDPAFIPAVVDICRREAVSLIVPTIDTELPLYAQHRAALEAVGTKVLVPDEATVAMGGDKKLTHEWLVSKRFPTVGQWDAAAAPEGLKLPLIAKPRFGSASIGIRRLSTRSELNAIRGKPDLIIQEIADGIEHTIDILVDSTGRCKCAVPRRRLEVRAGEVSKGVTVRNADLERLAINIAEALPGASGVLNIQVFFDPVKKRASVIELNPRFGGGFPLALEAGADFPCWVIEETLGLPCRARQDQWRSGIVMLRYDDAVFIKADEIGLTP